MAAKRRRESILQLVEAVKDQIEGRVAGPLGDLKAAQQILAYLSWLAWHCRRFAAVPSFLDAARSDIVAILYAGAIGMERSAYLHARSLLENLVRHCYYDTRPALYVGRHLDNEDGVRDKWAEQFLEIQRLPHFRPTWGTLDAGPTPSPAKEEAVMGGSALFAALKSAYGKSSRFVHGSTVRYRSAYEGIGSIAIDPARNKDLGAFLQDVGEIGIWLLSMAHIGPYLLISQPIRRYMLLEMRAEARTRLLQAMRRVSLPWARHQRAAALATVGARKRSAVASPDGLLLNTEGRALVVNPVRGEDKV